jgi:hypothetical protein
MKNAVGAYRIRPLRPRAYAIRPYSKQKLYTQGRIVKFAGLIIFILYFNLNFINHYSKY